MARLLALVLCLALAGRAQAQQTWPASYPEGPVWIDDTLYWAEMTADRVMAWTGGTPEIAFHRPGCGPTAVARYRRTDRVVLCHLEGVLVHLDGTGRPIGIIRRTPGGIALRNPNDASADGQGGVWFTDPGTFWAKAKPEGALFHLAPDGRLTRHATGLFYGNGVHVDRAGARVLVSEHLARRVLAFPVIGDGLGPAVAVIALDDLGLARPDLPEAGPDGLEIGPDGLLWVAEYGAGRLFAWAPDGGLRHVVTGLPSLLTNIAFGPGGLMAVTGADSNTRPPYPGLVRIGTLADILRPEPSIGETE